jgi:hypothetical protein
MVLAAKVFVVLEAVSLEELAMKLRDFRRAERAELEGQEYELLTEIRDLSLEGGALTGTYSQDHLLLLRYRGRSTPTPITFEAPFHFQPYQDQVYLTVMEKKQRANSIANDLSKILFLTAGHIVEAQIEPETLRRFHEENFEDNKVIFFDQVDLPNVDKLSLYGSELADTSLYSEYLKHGKVWYVVVRDREYGYVVGITRNCVVTAFSRIGEEELYSYITAKVFPLIAPPGPGR